MSVARSLEERSDMTTDINITVRAANQDDLHEVSRLLIHTWEETYTDILGAEMVKAVTSRWHTPEALSAGLQRDDGTFLVAIDKPKTSSEHRIVGTASVRLGPERVLNLLRLYVHPEHQGQGIGATLMAAALAPYDGKADELLLEVEPRNTRAVQFYEARGFQSVGTGTDCGGFGAALPHLIMSRPLPFEPVPLVS